MAGLTTGTSRNRSARSGSSRRRLANAGAVSKGEAAGPPAGGAALDAEGRQQLSSIAVSNAVTAVAR
ncbi:hypothetical protein GCM10010442_21160 [Kitasatospora kifunensis]